MKKLSIIILLVATLHGIGCSKSRDRSIKPETWFPDAKLTKQDYSHFQHSYSFLLDQGFPEIESTIKRKLGAEWIKADFEAGFVESFQEQMKASGITMKGFVSFAHSQNPHGEVSVTLVENTGENTDYSFTLLLTINDPIDFESDQSR